MSGGIFGANVLGAVDIRDTPLPCDFATIAAFAKDQGYDVYYFDEDTFTAGPPKPEFAANQYAHAFSSTLCSFVKWDGKLWVRDESMNQVLADWPKPAAPPPPPLVDKKQPFIPKTGTTSLKPPPAPPIEQPPAEPTKAGMGIGMMLAIGTIAAVGGWLLLRKKKR